MFKLRLLAFLCGRQALQPVQAKNTKRVCNKTNININPIKWMCIITNTVYCFTLSHIVPSVTRYWTTLAISLQCSRPAGLLLFTSILQSVRKVKGKLKACLHKQNIHNIHKQNISTFLNPLRHSAVYEMTWTVLMSTRLIRKRYFQEEHGLIDNRRLDVQNLVSQRRRGWGLTKRRHLSKNSTFKRWGDWFIRENATRSTFTITSRWMEALAIKLP